MLLVREQHQELVGHNVKDLTLMILEDFVKGWFMSGLLHGDGTIRYNDGSAYKRAMETGPLPWDWKFF